MPPSNLVARPDYRKQLIYLLMATYSLLDPHSTIHDGGEPNNALMRYALILYWGPWNLIEFSVTCVRNGFNYAMIPPTVHIHGHSIGQNVC